MRRKIAFSLVACFIFFSGIATAEPRVYRQIKDVAVKENGSVSQSDQKENLFEYTFDVDRANKTITRKKIQRLDKPSAREDATVYNITQKKELMGSEAGNGGKVLIAVCKDGSEILELSHRFAFTMRTSPFSQVITGVYKRVYDKDHKPHHPHPPEQNKKP
ncbi:MAG: hypothetical protein WCT39_03260 [Candidatus Margulisiibacteriota bacterium]